MANECGVGSPDITFAGVALNYLGEDGVTESGATGGAVKVTPTGSTTDTYCPFNVADPGTVSATAIFDATVDIDALVNTEASLTITYPITNSGNSTAATKVGNAILTEAGGVGSDNVKNIRNFVWQWSAAPTYTVESV
jgi:hypothetical protein